MGGSGVTESEAAEEERATIFRSGKGEPSAGVA